jgi:hypothetical protein
MFCVNSHLYQQQNSQTSGINSPQINSKNYHIQKAKDQKGKQ